jgi:hypothetical protein
MGLMTAARSAVSVALTGLGLFAAAIAFVPVASGIGGAAGLLVAWLSSTHSGWLVVPSYLAAGTLYGVLVWRLARAGFLIPPESV